MYYIRINPDNEEQDKLEYYCRQCGNNESQEVNISVSKTIIKQNDQKFSHIINRFTKLDPTLPRINTIDCPNKDCLTKKGTKNDIVGVKIDKQNLVWMYQCTICDTTWKQNSQAT
jgi:hypothetical protein